jgi:hypothetical protein
LGLGWLEPIHLIQTTKSTDPTASRSTHRML